MTYWPDLYAVAVLGAAVLCRFSAFIAWRDFIKRKRLLFVFSQRRVADAAHRATNAHRGQSQQSRLELGLCLSD